jgi:hypothetical protein
VDMLQENQMSADSRFNSNIAGIFVTDIYRIVGDISILIVHFYYR